MKYAVKIACRMGNVSFSTMSGYLVNCCSVQTIEWKPLQMEVKHGLRIL